MNNEPAAWRTQFSVWHLMVLTFLCCLTFAFCRWIGFQGTFLLASVCFTFAPLAAFVTACLPAQCQWWHRAGIAMSLLAALSVIEALAIANSDFPETLVLTAAGTVCIWPLQGVMLAAVYSAWKSGMESARRAEEEVARLQESRQSNDAAAN